MKTTIDSLRKGLAFLAMLVSTSGAADLWVFDKGMPARASEINANFQEILRRLDTLNRMLREQSALRDSLPVLRGKMRADSLALQAGLRGKIRADSLALSAGVLLPGAVAGFLVAPDMDGYLPNSDRSWVFAANQKTLTSTGIPVPDLRGQFLRGIDTAIGGSLAGTDPDGMRKPGSIQRGMLQTHLHQTTTTYNWSGSSGPPSPLSPGFQKNSGLSFDTLSTKAFGGSETRPTNVAVYWYVKVK